jgi:protein SCO1/2
MIELKTSRALSLCLVGLALCAEAGLAQAADEHAHHHHQMQAAAAKPVNTVKQSDYKIPAIRLTRSDGQAVDLAAELGGDRPVMLNFIFTTCTTICPVMSHTFADVQARLGADAGKLRMLSISIDPEHDTPARLKEYAARFSAGPQWSFYTGTAAASVAAQKAFEAYRGDKMNHEPLTLMRKAPGKPWVRVDGLASADTLVAQYRKLLAEQ